MTVADGEPRLATAGARGADGVEWGRCRQPEQIIGQIADVHL
jgi:hypothetical protein